MATYKIKIQSSGDEFNVKPSQTILEGAIDAGITMPYGCQDGACGSCKGKVVSGRFYIEEYQSSALTDSEKEEGYTLFCKTMAQEDLVIETNMPNMYDSIPAKVTPVRVESLQKLNHDVMQMYLKLPASETLPFKAGQYIEFIMVDGSRRAFSMANPPHKSMIELHLRLIEGGEFTSFVFNEMKEKSIHRIEGPIGQFYLRESERPIIFIAGGTGFAPIKSIIEEMIFNKNKRKIYLYRGVRSAEDFYMTDLVSSWKKKLGNLTYIPVVEDGSSTDLRSGYVHHAVLEDFKKLSDVQVYCCGAPGLVENAFIDLIKNGLPEDQFFADAFTFSPKKK
ncbi:MAG: CDP-6-deoxy-delta-3,4-glucoseen reductase [Nitrosomonadales bacterium]|jgi:CDP-4-dehydro-6-deoxyglucose reductase|nr:CDP-6-deoxy-delta-3,4-glucoseen reductase [Nitrosomonadales bacterium]MBT5573593.1 CDP-6-deoxy-delta-3,4-glucoseen reductase [Nitrosomonadales bacterium]MBT6251537.1 CDP-6-deoxy-delta-3,4-glucoseen reductase [Nitrosomonadales bacterium]